MGRLTKLIVLFFFVIVAAYVVQTEPNFGNDPMRALSRSGARLHEACDSQSPCRLAMETAANAQRMAEVGWGLATGRGRLVYVPQTGAANGQPRPATVIGSRNGAGGVGSSDPIAGILDGAARDDCR